ncbi:MAG: flagellar biosynthesis protein [Burkholderiales bacterium 12-64-5]|nr:MAG: flagellar biosynthesis protein [Burkholderiales bacterium 12-64-5]
MTPTDPVPARAPNSAVALTYSPGSTAPRVVARGYGLIADEIVARARAHGVFVHQSRELVSLLMQVDLDRHIPPELYRVVAELLVWVHRLEAGGTAAPALRLATNTRSPT